MFVSITGQKSSPLHTHHVDEALVPDKGPLALGDLTERWAGKKTENKPCGVHLAQTKSQQVTDVCHFHWQDLQANRRLREMMVTSISPAKLWKTPPVT